VHLRVMEPLKSIFERPVLTPPPKRRNRKRRGLYVRHRDIPEVPDWHERPYSDQTGRGRNPITPEETARKDEALYGEIDRLRRESKRHAHQDGLFRKGKRLGWWASWEGFDPWARSMYAPETSCAVTGMALQRHLDLTGGRPFQLIPDGSGSFRWESLSWTRSESGIRYREARRSGLSGRKSTKPADDPRTTTCHAPKKDKAHFRKLLYQIRQALVPKQMGMDIWWTEQLPDACVESNSRTTPRKRFREDITIFNPSIRNTREYQRDVGFMMAYFRKEDELNEGYRALCRSRRKRPTPRQDLRMGRIITFLFDQGFLPPPAPVSEPLNASSKDWVVWDLVNKEARRRKLPELEDIQEPTEDPMGPLQEEGDPSQENGYVVSSTGRMRMWDLDESPAEFDARCRREMEEDLERVRAKRRKKPKKARPTSEGVTDAAE